MNRRLLVRRLVLALALGLVARSLTAPGRAADEASETRDLSGFNSIRLNGAFSVDVTVGGHRSAVVVSGSRDAIERVTTKVEGDTLVVGMRSGNWSFDHFARLAIALPALRLFSNEGAGSAKIDGITGGDFTIENAGAAKIVAAGRVDRETITLDGAGKIDTTALEARDVTVDNNGVGSVRVRASGSLTMNVNGLGEIRYAGNPTHVESHINGIGRIGRL